MRILLLSAVIASQFLSAQIGKVGINTTNPQATIDMKIADVNLNGNTPEGLLIPRIGRERVNNMGTAVEQSTMVYINTLDGTASGRVANVNKVGFYHFNGTEWIGLDNSKTPYDVTLTPSATSINIGESLSLNVKSNIPSQFFYNSENKGILKKAVNGNAEIISEFAVIGSEGNLINSNGTDYIFTPTSLGSQNVKFYFYDSDNNLIIKNLPIQVNGQIGDDLIKLQGSYNQQSIYDGVTFEINGSGNTQYEFSIERTGGAPFPYFSDTNLYGNFNYGQWYDYLNQPIEFDLLKQTPGVSSMLVKVRKKNSQIIEAQKELRFNRKLYLDDSRITPMSKTMQVNTFVELKLENFNEGSNSANDPEALYFPIVGVLRTNLPILIESRNASGGQVYTTYSIDENGPVYGTNFSLEQQNQNPAQPKRFFFKPTTVGTYILRFNMSNTSKIVDIPQNREITVVLNVTP